MFVSIKEIAEKKQQDVVDELVKIEGNNWSIDKHSMVDYTYYNQYKADKEKPLVIDYEYNNERCKVPQLNIEHPNAEAINNRILEVNKDGVEAILEAEKKGYDLGILNLRYHYSVNGDILSLLFIE